MKKVIVASFQCESNSKANLHPQKSDFEYFVGDDIFKKLVVKDIFENAGFTVIPSIYANALPSATVERDIYEFYKEQIMDTVRSHPDADGVYIYVHGSMEVDGIGSGELQLVKEIRDVVRRECLIAFTMDLHANITDELGEYVDIVCGYKTAPHTDQNESQLRAATALAYCLTNGVRPHTYVQKIPMLVKGDTMLTKYEPLATLEAETAALEQREDVFGANLFFGHCWIDAPNTSASAVVSAVDEQDAKTLAQELADKLWNTRRDYRFLIEAELPEECVRRALVGDEHRIFITDSGDNTTAGAEGTTTELLQLLLKSAPEKPTCVAGITDRQAVEDWWALPDGAPIPRERFSYDGIIKSHGRILGWAKEIIGRSVTVSFGNVDAVFTEKRSAFIEKGNFDEANVDLLGYRIVVVKLGYLFEELKPFADRELFALSDGASCVELARLDLKRIKRPMFPLEDFEWSAQ